MAIHETVDVATAKEDSRKMQVSVSHFYLLDWNNKFVL